MLVGSLIAGIPDPFAPLRLLRLFVVIVVTAFALISLMFLLMVRVNDPLVPRAIFGVLNTLLYFPSGAVYPQQGFPAWMQVIAVVGSVHLCRARVQEPAAEEHGDERDHDRHRLPRRVLGRRDDRGHDALQTDALRGRERRPLLFRRPTVDVSDHSVGLFRGRVCAGGDTRVEHAPRGRIGPCAQGHRRLVFRGATLVEGREDGRRAEQDRRGAAPPYVSAAQFDREKEEGLYLHYGRTGFWTVRTPKHAATTFKK